MRRGCRRCFFSFEFALYDRFEATNNFDFRLLWIFRYFLLLFEVMNMFYKVFRYFFCFLWSKYGWKLFFCLSETSQPNFSRTKGMIGDILSTSMRQVVRRLLFFLLKNLKSIRQVVCPLKKILKK